MSDWSQGPWMLNGTDETGAVFIVGDNLGGLVGAALPWPTEIDAGGSDRVISNAHLIAAAPDLYEALVDLFGYASAPLDGRDMSGRAVVYRAAQAALARARGEAQ